MCLHLTNLSTSSPVFRAEEAEKFRCENQKWIQPVSYVKKIVVDLFFYGISTIYSYALNFYICTIRGDGRSN